MSVCLTYLAERALVADPPPVIAVLQAVQLDVRPDGLYDLGPCAVRKADDARQRLDNLVALRQSLEMQMNLDLDGRRQGLARESHWRKRPHDSQAILRNVCLRWRPNPLRACAKIRDR